MELVVARRTTFSHNMMENTAASIPAASTIQDPAAGSIRALVNNSARLSLRDAPLPQPAPEEVRRRSTASVASSALSALNRMIIILYLIYIQL